MRLAKLLFLAALSLWSTAFASSDDGTRFLCGGSSASYLTSPPEEFPIESALLLLKADTVRISGSGYFDGSYAVSNTMANGIGFQSVSDKAYSGFLDRYSGKLSLTHKGETFADGSFKVRQVLTASCSRASEPFF